MATTKGTTLPTLEDLAQAGVHFGHRTRQWNPKMQEYIYGVLDGVHIIDLEKTLNALKEATEYLSKRKKENATIVIVGTKRQAAPVVKSLAQEAGLFYVTERWPGGLITNFDNIHEAIVRYEELIKQMEDKEYVDSLTTKQKYINLKEIERSSKLFGGLKGITQKPDTLIVVDPRREKSAVHEANITDTPVVAIVDTNTNPQEVTYPIPGNDDALKSIEILLTTLVNALK